MLLLKLSSFFLGGIVLLVYSFIQLWYKIWYMASSKLPPFSPHPPPWKSHLIVTHTGTCKQLWIPKPMPIFHMSMLHLLNYSQGVPVSVLHPCKSLEPCADHSKTCLSDELWNTHNYQENMSVSAIHITQTADQQKQMISRFMLKSYTSCQEERLFSVVVVFKFIMSMFKLIPVPHEYQTWMFYLQKKKKLTWINDGMFKMSIHTVC